MVPRLLKFMVLFSILLAATGEGFAQLTKITNDLDEQKPKKYENRELRSEKTGDKKFTVPRRFIQNTTSHYNYYFNAHNKLSHVIEMARIAHEDDLDRLVSYYGYSPLETMGFRNELDSVVLKSTAGILLHDLRSDWVDNFYFMIGKAYYFMKEYDSAYMAFQFINYNLFPREKGKEDEQLIVGSNVNDMGNALSISTEEDRNFFERLFSQPPSRNDALLWQIRTLTQMERFGSAAGLINTLRNDPNFPERLETTLDETEGYWFFKQGMYDSAITFIEQSLPGVLDLQEQARREYLLGQLYERNHSNDTAAYYYSKAIHHTTDPLLNIYANMNKAMMLRSNDPNEIKLGVNKLLRLAGKDDYEDYRHIIYFSAARMAMAIPDTVRAMNFYLRSARYNEQDIPLQNQAFLRLADLSYDLKYYRDAYNFYDSLRIPDSTLGDMSTITKRKNALARVVEEIEIIHREDSLQQIAAMPAFERDDYMKKLSRRLRRERGVPEEETGTDNPVFLNDNNQPVNIFGNTPAKGDWYFYNNSLKSKGQNEFEREWGDRANVDNWRRLSDNEGKGSMRGNRMPNGLPNLNPGDMDPMSPDGPDKDFVKPETIDDINFQQDISVEGLEANLPLNGPMLDSSNGRKARALYALGQHYQKLLEDYAAAVNTYEQSLEQFPDSLYDGALYMNLSYCYDKLGNAMLANAYKNKLLQQFGSSKYADRVLHPEKYLVGKIDTAATNKYEDIYNQFIEGNFEEALQNKLKADSIYGETHWNPQLLYIEAVYFIQQREDSVALGLLEKIANKYPGTPMSNKAVSVIKVLRNRDSIENYLTQLEVTRIPADSQIVVFEDTRIYGNIGVKPVRNDSNLLPKKITTVDVPELNDEFKKPEAVVLKNFVFDPLHPQHVIMLLTKVDPVYSSEARRALQRYNAQKYYRLNLNVTKDTLDSARTLLVIEEFAAASEALKYMNQLKKDAGVEVSWLPANKYSFYIISEDNLALLKQNKKLDDYMELLHLQYPEQFPSTPQETKDAKEKEQ